MRIMYVEDNMANLALIERVARMGGHQVVSYPSGEQALNALETDSCQLILMDIELEGDIDGVEVVKRLRARGDTRPVIAVTAYAMVGDMERILAAGCNEYLPKPVPIAQFLRLLAKYDPNNISPAKTAPLDSEEEVRPPGQQLTDAAEGPSTQVSHHPDKRSDTAKTTHKGNPAAPNLPSSAAHVTPTSSQTLEEHSVSLSHHKSSQQGEDHDE